MKEKARVQRHDDRGGDDAVGGVPESLRRSGAPLDAEETWRGEDSEKEEVERQMATGPSRDDAVEGVPEALRPLGASPAAKETFRGGAISGGQKGRKICPRPTCQ